MKYFLCLFIICSFFSVKSVKADFCDPSLWQNIETSQIHTGIYVRGWDVNQDCLDENGRPTTPLHIAVANTQNMYALTAFIMEGANLLAVNDADQTPYAVLRELDQTMYGQLQQANHSWNSLVEEEYEQAQSKIAQRIQNESNPEMVNEMEAASQEISDRWKRLGQTPVDEAQARYDQVQQVLGVIGIFTRTRLAMLSSEYETYTPVVTDETYNEARDIRDFLSFVNGKLMALDLDPITSSLLPMLSGFDDARNPDTQTTPLSPVVEPSEINLISSLNENDLTVDILDRLLSLFNDLRNLFDELCPNADAIDMCEIINNQLNNIRYAPQALETITASILWDLIYALNAIYHNINDLALTIDATEYTGRIIDIRYELVDLEMQVRDKHGNDTRSQPEGSNESEEFFNVTPSVSNYSVPDSDTDEDYTDTVNAGDDNWEYAAEEVEGRESPEPAAGEQSEALAPATDAYDDDTDVEPRDFPETAEAGTSYNNAEGLSEEGAEEIQSVENEGRPERLTIEEQTEDEGPETSERLMAEEQNSDLERPADFVEVLYFVGMHERLEEIVLDLEDIMANLECGENCNQRLMEESRDELDAINGLTFKDRFADRPLLGEVIDRMNNLILKLRTVSHAIAFATSIPPTEDLSKIRDRLNTVYEGPSESMTNRFRPYFTQDTN